MVLHMHINTSIALLTFFFFVEDASLQHLDQETFYFYNSRMDHNPWGEPRYIYERPSISSIEPI